MTINSTKDVATEIRKEFNPNNLISIFSGGSFSLKEMIQMHGKVKTEMFVALALRELNEFTAVEKKLSVQQIDKLSNVILAEYKYLKTSELLLFVHKFKSGEYGDFFKSIDSLKITSALKKFMLYRERILESISRKNEKEKRSHEYEEHKKGCISANDYAKNYGFKNETLKRIMSYGTGE